MIAFVLFGLFFVMVICNVPIAVSLGLSAIISIGYMGFDISSAAPLLYAGITKFTLLAIPFFILAGLIMEKAGISARLIRLAEVFLGNLRGSLAIISVVVACFFAAISGSGPATVAAVGSVMIPAMISKGYGRIMPPALMSAAGSIGIIIPPSVGFVVFATLAEVSVTRLFLSGIFPGLVMGGCYIICSLFLLRNNTDIVSENNKYTMKEKFIAFRDALWGIFTPVIILGGIYGGIFTPTEAAGVAVVYGLVVGCFIYRSLKLKDIYQVLVNAAISSAVVMFIVACASIFGWLLTTSLVARRMTEALISLTTNKIVLLVIMNIIFLMAGCFVDTISAYYILTPIMLPIIRQIGYDIYVFGVFATVNLAIGQFTPPVGANLYIACNIAREPLKNVIKASIPFIIAGMTGLILITYIPQIAIVLPNLLMKK